MDTMLERLERLEAAARVSERRARAWQLAVAALLVLGLALVPMRRVIAQGGGPPSLPALAARVTALEQQVASLQTALSNETADLQAALAAETAARQAGDTALQRQVTPLAAKLERVSIQQFDGFYSIVVDGANLHLRNGLGATNGNSADPINGQPAVNGLGNLIIGYNASRGAFGSDLRSGSHNLIVGDQHDYSWYGGLVAGRRNSILAPYASVSGGTFNTASESYASVSGGVSNTATEFYASISGGSSNFASGLAASVSGGGNNTASGNSTSVSGGAFNTASGPEASVSGGRHNTASNFFASVSGGEQNTASHRSASVSGGENNTASGAFASVSGGRFKTQSSLGVWQGGTLISGP